MSHLYSNMGRSVPDQHKKLTDFHETWYVESYDFLSSNQILASEVVWRKNLFP